MAPNHLAAMEILIAFDKFKEALSAPEACRIAAREIALHFPTATIHRRPLTDGGEGFVDTLVDALGGEYRELTVTGPYGQRVTARWGLLDATTIPPTARSQLNLPAGARRLAVVEMANASGLALTASSERDPWLATSRGIGEVIAAATDAGVDGIVIGLGGSATNDLGLGALGALGLTYHSSPDDAIAVPFPATWSTIARIGGALRPDLPPLRVACDVTNPVLGPRGASAVYGPQKGLQPDDLPRMDAAMARMAHQLCAHLRAPDSLIAEPGSGAAGAIAAGFLATGRAQLLPGFDFVSTLLGLPELVATADLIVTGEGGFDDSSLEGKGPGSLVTAGLAAGKDVAVFAGRIQLTMTPVGLSVHPVSPPSLPLAQALRETPQRLAAAVRTGF